MEEETDFTLFLSNKDSQFQHSDNDTYQFTIFLLREFRLEGKWQVCLRDISYLRNREEGRFNEMCLTCNIVKPAYIFNTYAHVVARVPTFRAFGREAVIISHPQYVDVIRSEFAHLDFQLLDETMRFINLEETVFFTLHLKKVKNGE